MSGRSRGSEFTIIVQIAGVCSDEMLSKLARPAFDSPRVHHRDSRTARSLFDGRVTASIVGLRWHGWARAAWLRYRHANVTANLDGEQKPTKVIPFRKATVEPGLAMAA
jgi:hypothetical protein